MVDLIENLNFRGREIILDEIDNRFKDCPNSERQRRVVLFGLGGIGKSQIALRYAYTHGGNYDAVFWVSCTTKRALRRSYLKVEQILRMPLIDWYTKYPQKTWLLILDNLDQPGSVDLASWLPTNTKGRVIITSRLTNLGSLGHMIPVEPLDEKSGVAMLLSASSGRMHMADDPRTASSIVRLLGGLPLAIQQCAAYVSSQRRRLSEYSLSFDSLMRELELYEREHGLDCCLSDAKTLLTTWNISFDAVSLKNQGSGDLLCLFALIDGTDIAIEILLRGFSPQKYWGPDGNIASPELDNIIRSSKRSADLKGSDKLELAISTLVSYSLIFRTKSGTSIYMHPVRPNLSIIDIRAVNVAS